MSEQGGAGRMNFSTADIHDSDPCLVQVCDIQFRSFGRRLAFGGPCTTLRVHEDHHTAKQLFAAPGGGRVLVIDGGASVRVGLVGDRMSALGAENGWAGAIVLGAIRDSAAIDALDFGVKALFTTARRSVGPVSGTVDIPLQFGNATFVPGAWVYADGDSVIVRTVPL